MMKKKILSTLSYLAMANVEALAGNEGGGSNCLHGEVPGRFIESGGPVSAEYSSNSSGSITVGGNEFGGYAKNTSIEVMLETFNCSGIQKGSCCDQDRVGTFII